MKPCRRPVRIVPRPRRWISSAIACLAFALVAAGQVTSDPEKPQVKEAPNDQGTATAHLIRVPLPITGTVDDQVKQRIDQLLERNQNGHPRPVLVLEFSPEHDGFGEGSQFERSFALARYLTSDRVRRARTIAFLPQSLRGHAVLVATACEEIIMHPDAELGRSGIDESVIDATIAHAYRDVATRARTIPVAVALGMLDRRVETVRLETAIGTQYVLAEEVEPIGRETTILSQTTIIPRGEMGNLTGREMRLEHSFVSRLARDRAELAKQLDLPPRSLQAKPTSEGKWQPVQIRLTGAVDANRRLQVQWKIEESVRSGDVNFICLRIDSSGGIPLEVMGLTSFLAELDSAAIRTVAYVPSEALANASLLAFACDEVVMHEDAVLGGTGAYEMSPEELRDIGETLKEDWSRRKSANWSLQAAMLDPTLVVHQYRLQGKGTVRYFCDEELAQQPDPSRWTREEIIASSDEPFQVTGLQARELGMAQHVVNSFDQFKQAYHLEDDPALVEPGWAEVIVSALARPELAGTLVFVGFFALIFEFMSPGIGAGGFIAFVCYLLFFWSQFLNGTAGVARNPALPGWNQLCRTRGFRHPGFRNLRPRWRCHGCGFFSPRESNIFATPSE